MIIMIMMIMMMIMMIISSFTGCRRWLPGHLRQGKHFFGNSLKKYKGNGKTNYAIAVIYIQLE